MRLHGILTIVALLLIAGGALPMLMGETMSLTGEHDGAMFGELLFTVGTDPYYVGDFKHTNIHESSLQLYGVMGGVEIPVTLDDIDYEKGRYALNYLLSLDTNQVLNLDGTYADGVFTDLSGNGNHGTPYNGATTGTGVVGDGMSFDGVDDYLDCENDTSLDINGNISCSIFVKADTKANYQTVLGKRTATTGYYMILDGSGDNIQKMFFILKIGTVSRIISSEDIVPIGEYINYSATYDGSTMKMYVNGILQTPTLTISGNIDTNAEPLIIGCRQSVYDFWDGNLDEIRIYDRALTPDEVSYLNDCVDVSNIEYPYGTEIYASYTYSDTFAPIGSDLFGLGVSLVGCVMLIVVVVGSTGRW